jgi:hypothetical protein
MTPLLLTRRALLLGASLAPAMGCASAPATSAAPAVAQDAAAFVVTLGNDTVSAESFTRTGDRVEGTVVRRSPRTNVLRYTMQLSPAGLPTRLEYNVRLPDGSMLPNGARSVVVTYTGDSAITEAMRDTAIVRRVAARNIYPLIDGAVAPLGYAIAALRASGRDSAHFLGYTAGAAAGEDNAVVRRGPNTWWVYSFGSPIEVTTDAAGRIQRVDASRTTFRIQSTRLAPMDLGAITARFVERERTSGPLVALSPRDSTMARFGDAQISIFYGRPSVRGRRIWGPNGVLGDTLWRTGANNATTFTTTGPLVVGGQELPAGRYVINTLAIPGRYQLILSQENREVLRAPLASRTLATPVEQFTMRLESTTERAGVLRLQWDTLELSVPVAAR